MVEDKVAGSEQQFENQSDKFLQIKKVIGGYTKSLGLNAGDIIIGLNGDLFVEETNYGRILYFNSDGSLRWTHVNRAKNGNVYNFGWSRILYTKENIQTVINFLDKKGLCNE